MPSFLHEAVVALCRSRPSFAVDLLSRSSQLGIPDHSNVRVEDSDLTQLQPAQFKADLVVLLESDAPSLVIVVETQLAVDARKLFTWPLYQAATRARYECPSVVLVVTPSEPVAQWAATRIDLGGGNGWAPIVVGPEVVPVITETDVAKADPELAVMSAIAHGNEGEVGQRVALTAIEAARGLEDERASVYSDVVLASPGESARIALEKLMATGYQFQSEFVKKNIALGKAEGKAEAVLEVLEARGIAVTEEQRALVLATKEIPTLDRWLVRAVTAEDAGAVFAD